MPRASWKGFIRLSLVTVPVQAYTATESGGKIQLHQLHEACNSRIRYAKTCPIHGEVPREEIVMGYEYGKNQYAVIDPAEVDKLRTESDRAITIDRFIAPDDLDPLYFAGRTYYLMPDGAVGRRPYVLLQKIMTEDDLYGVAQVVLGGKEQLMVLRPANGLIAMSVLHYATEVRQADQVGEAPSGVETTDEELRLTRMLVDATRADGFDPERYKDLYNERLTQLIEAKVQGKEVVTPPQEEIPEVINLMDALKASLERAPEAASPAEAEEPKRKKKVAGSARTRPAKRKRKKTG